MLIDGPSTIGSMSVSWRNISISLIDPPGLAAEEHMAYHELWMKHTCYAPAQDPPIRSIAAAAPLREESDEEEEDEEKHDDEEDDDGDEGYSE